MALILTIENQESVPEGVPVSVRLGTEGGLDIGRNANLDWTLPDPSRFISGKHCEVRYRDDAYWLYDLSTNGTYVNHDPRRLKGPHRLCDGDRLGIGSYIIAVNIEPDDKFDLANTTGRISPGVALGEVGCRDAGDSFGFPDSGALQEHPSGDSYAVLAANIGSAARLLNSEASEPDAARRADSANLGTPEAHPAPTEAQAREARAWREPERPPVSQQPIEHEARRRDPAVPGEGKAPAEIDEHLRRFAAAAGIPEHVFAGQDSLKVAGDLGALMRMAVENLVQLLEARFKAERLARVSRQTMIQALDNNPLKFAPTPADALKIMFGPRTSGYLDAKRALEAAFTDLKTHQVDTFAAMQQAVRMLVEDLDPKSIDKAVGPDKGFEALFGSRRARLWDMFLARWQAKALRHEDGLVGAFMIYFGECYDEAKETKAAFPRS